MYYTLEFHMGMVTGTLPESCLTTANPGFIEADLEATAIDLDCEPINPDLLEGWQAEVDNGGNVVGAFVRDGVAIAHFVIRQAGPEEVTEYEGVVDEIVKDRKPKFWGKSEHNPFPNGCWFSFN
jgi:hypothetical protein